MHMDDDESLVNYYHCAFQSTFLLFGSLFITTKNLRFYSVFNEEDFFSSKCTYLKIPLEIIENVEPAALLLFDNCIHVQADELYRFTALF